MFDNIENEFLEIRHVVTEVLTRKFVSANKVDVKFNRNLAVFCGVALEF